MANISPIDALGDPTRRQLFEYLRHGPCSVTELISIVPISQPAVSQHLKVLKEADELIRNVHYEAASKSFILVILLGFVYSLASQVFGEWEDAGAILWVIASVAYQINYRRAWRRFDV